MKKKRLDLILTEKKLAESRSKAQRMIMAGDVRVNGQVVYKSSEQFIEDIKITIKEEPKFVSRGGYKLEGALQTFNLLDFSGKICVDVGASTGGFTDCLLQYGAEKVYAVDVGFGILHWKLRNHPQVISMERTNARYVFSFPEKIDFVVVDASFIPLKILLPVIKTWFSEEGGMVVALIKPQFEAGRKIAAKGKGVIRDSKVHYSVLQNVLEFAQNEGFEVEGLETSSIFGPKGNKEFLVQLLFPGRNLNREFSEIISRLLPDLLDETDQEEPD